MCSPSALAAKKTVRSSPASPAAPRAARSQYFTCPPAASDQNRSTSTATHSAAGVGGAPDCAAAAAFADVGVVSRPALLNPPPLSPSALGAQCGRARRPGKYKENLDFRALFGHKRRRDVLRKDKGTPASGRF